MRNFLIAIMLISIPVFALSNPKPLKKKEIERIIKLHQQNSFSGVKLYKYKRKNYLICAVEVNVSASQDNYTLAKVKAQAFINEFLNGASVSSASSFILEENTSSKSSSDNSEIDTKSAQEYVNKMITTIKTNASGFVNNIESIANYKGDQSSMKMVYLFAKQI